MRLVDPHQCGSPETCHVRLLDLEEASYVFVKKTVAPQGFWQKLGVFGSPNAGGKIANVYDVEVMSPLGTRITERWYVCFKAELYWYFGKRYKHPEWGLGASVPIVMLADAKYNNDARIAVIHDIDVCYGMRAADWLRWAEDNRTIDLNQKPDPSAGVALKFMKRLF